jgi:hypothetical protein
VGQSARHPAEAAEKKPYTLHGNLDFSPGALGKVYNSLVLIAHLMQQLDPGDPWPRQVRDHLLTLDPALLPRLGAPGDWSTRPLWAAL